MAVLLATGVIAGLLAGLLGVGGGIVIVPVLFQMFELLAVPDDIRMHLARGTSLTTIVATALISARAHDRRRNRGLANSGRATHTAAACAPSPMPAPSLPMSLTAPSPPPTLDSRMGMKPRVPRRAIAKGARCVC